MNVHIREPNQAELIATIAFVAEALGVSRQSVRLEFSWTENGTSYGGEYAWQVMAPIPVPGRGPKRLRNAFGASTSLGAAAKECIDDAAKWGEFFAYEKARKEATKFVPTSAAKKERGTL